jgi:hypothetical protein
MLQWTSRMPLRARTALATFPPSRLAAVTSLCISHYWDVPTLHICTFTHFLLPEMAEHANPCS